MTALWTLLVVAAGVLVVAALLPAAPAGSGSRVARVLIAPVRVYQRWISPALPPTCRFAPSCSAYAVEALRRHGAVRGAALAVWRLLRCHPWHPGGLDPVPPVRRGAVVSGPARPPSESEPC